MCYRLGILSTISQRVTSHKRILKERCTDLSNGSIDRMVRIKWDPHHMSLVNFVLWYKPRRKWKTHLVSCLFLGNSFDCWVVVVRVLKRMHKVNVLALVLLLLLVLIGKLCLVNIQSNSKKQRYLSNVFLFGNNIYHCKVKRALCENKD